MAEWGIVVAVGVLGLVALSCIDRLLGRRKVRRERYGISEPNRRHRDGSDGGGGSWFGDCDGGGD